MLLFSSLRLILGGKLQFNLQKMNIGTKKDRLIHFQRTQVQRKKKGGLKDTFRILGFYIIFTEEVVGEKEYLQETQ